MADVQILRPATSAAPLDFPVPGSMEIVVKALRARFDGSGAASQFYPCVRVIAPGGGIAGEYIAETAIDPGGSGDVSWAPFLRTVQPGVTFPRNMGELGISGSGTQAANYTHTIRFEDVHVGDRVLVSAQAPSVPVALAAPRSPSVCTDSQGHSYTPGTVHFWEASPPNVNEGARQRFFLSEPIVFPLVKDVDTITVTWPDTVFDRSIDAWLIRHDGGSPEATEIASSPDNDAATFTATQVTLQSPSYTPPRDNSLFFATTLAAKAGGLGSFGGVAGFAGYFQALFRFFSGSKQFYFLNPSTYGANALLINEFGALPYEIDLGQLPGGVNVPAFNGVAQNYSGGANAWKGITIFSIE
jgi:hypothetical protein